MLTRAGEGHCRQSYPPLQSVSTEHLLFAWCCAGAGEAAVPEAGEARASEELTYSSSRLSNMSSIQPTAVSMLWAYSMLDAFSFNLQVPLYPFPPVSYTFKNQDLLTCVLNTRTLLSAFSWCSLTRFFAPYISHKLAAGGGLTISPRFHLFGSTAGGGEHFVWFCFFVMLAVPCPLIHSGFAKAVIT